MTTTPPPPAELDWLASLIGPAATLALIERYAGVRVYIPHKVTARSNLARVIGLDDARALSAEFGRLEIKVPACKYWRARVYHGRGMSAPEIALLLGCGLSSVWRYIGANARAPDHKMRAEAPRQGSLGI